MKNKKQKLTILLSILSILVITIGITYAFFSYTKQGTTDNVIQTGTITFLYTEIDKVGAGIEIKDAYPISNELGKAQTGDNKVFNFKIKADSTSTTALNYEITAKKSSDSTLDDSIVKLYLTEVNETEENELVLAKFSNLALPSKEGLDTESEKLLYKGKVPSNTQNYEKSFRLRMWIDEKTDFSGVEQEDGTIVYPHNDKTFKININVYADGNVITQEDIDLESNTDISGISANNIEMTKVEDENSEFQYKVLLPANTTETTLNFDTVNEYTNVSIEEIENLAYETSNIKRLSSSKTVPLTAGHNFFKVMITSEDNKNTESLIIRITVLNYEIEKPIISFSNTSNVYPILTTNGFELEGTATITFDDNPIVKNYYSVDNGKTWNEYNGPFSTKNSTIIAKSVDEDIDYEVVETYTIALASNALGYNAYDGDTSTYIYIPNGSSYYFKVSEDMIGATLYCIGDRRFNYYNSSMSGLGYSAQMTSTKIITLHGSATWVAPYSRGDNGYVYELSIYEQ